MPPSISQIVAKALKRTTDEIKSVEIWARVYFVRFYSGKPTFVSRYQSDRVAAQATREHWNDLQKLLGRNHFFAATSTTSGKVLDKNGNEIGEIFASLTGEFGFDTGGGFWATKTLKAALDGVIISHGNQMKDSII